MDEIVTGIAGCWRSSRSLSDCLSSADLTGIASDPAVAAAYARLCKDELGMAELSTSTARGKVSSVHNRDGWSVILIKDYVVSEDIVLSPCPAMLVPFHEDTVVRVDIYRAGEGSFRRSKLPEPGAVQRIGSETVSFGQAWATPAEGVCANIAAIDGRSTILLVNGPPYAPYTHSLGARMEYRSSAFSSDLYNGRVFLSDLIKHAVTARLQNDCDPAEVERLKDYIGATTARDDVVSEEAWPLVQSMSALDRTAAIDILSRLGASDHELAPAARSTLSANGIHADAGEDRARL